MKPLLKRIEPPPGLEITASGDVAIFSYPIPSPTLPTRLTTAERAVVALVLSGLSNADVARRRGCAVRTVANHLASIYRKLNVGSRAELAARCCRPSTGPTRPPTEERMASFMRKRTSHQSRVRPRTAG